MKIAFVSANLETGGIERVVNSLSNFLIQQGHVVHIIATKDGKCSYEMDARIVRHILQHNSKLGRTSRVIHKLREFRGIIREEHFDVMLSFGSYVTMYTVAASRLLNTKIIGSERTDPSKAPESALLRGVRNIAYRFTDAMVFQTKDAQAYFSKRIQKKSHVIPNPIKENLPPRWEGERTKEIVNFCRLNHQKNLPLLLKAFAKFHATHPQYQLIIYGEGELKQSLLVLAEKLGIKNSFEIRNFTPDIHRCIQKSAMFVSSSDYEGISNSMLEAMAIGLPCICTDCPVGGARMFIRNYENGILVPVGDANKLVEAMTRFASNQQFANKIGLKALEIKDIISLDKIAFKWLKVIDATITIT